MNDNNNKNRFEQQGATVSKCGKYRYQLWRIWDDDPFKPKVAFIMLNPSTADADNDDPTIRRCISFAKSWGYAGLSVFNLYAYKATDPKELKKQASKGVDIVGINNDTVMSELSKQGTNYDVVFAWGNYQFAESRIRKMIQLFPFAKCIKKTKNGYPCHPLYLKGDLVPINFK